MGNLEGFNFSECVLAFESGRVDEGLGIESKPSL